MSQTTAELIELASRLEATAPKVGNVHPGADFVDLTYQDFLESASAAAVPLATAADVGIGNAVLAAISATRQRVQTNTNLGIALLVAPLAAVPGQLTVQQGIAPVLEGLSVADAEAAYAAIRLAEPGGMGDVDEADVKDTPVIDLLEAMKLAAPRDLIASEYSTGFNITLEETVPSLVEAFERTGDILTAIVQTQLVLLARHPDSLITRRHGDLVAAAVQQKSSQIQSSLWPESDQVREHVLALDAWMRQHSPRLNPGTIADLLCAGLFVALRDHTELSDIRNGPLR